MTDQQANTTGTATCPGGHKQNPTFPEICGGHTGNSEARQVYFEPAETDYVEFLKKIWGEQ